MQASNCETHRTSIIESLLKYKTNTSFPIPNLWMSREWYYSIDLTFQSY